MQAAIGEYMREASMAGVLLTGEGVHGSAQGARVEQENGAVRVIDGPFAEAKELIAGYWLVQFKTKEECIEWAKRVPFKEGEIEIRQLFELEEFTQGPAIEHHRQLQDTIKKA
jgi:hypothetical protein